MSKVRVVAIVVLGAAALVGAFVGLRCYQDYRRACADKRAVACLREYSRIVGKAQEPVAAAKLNPVIAEMTELSGRCSSDVDEALFSCRLDGTFLIGDYAQAEKIMDDLPGRSANWKEGAKAKIRAHAALKKGDKVTAIREFETFCETLLKESPDAVEFDPYDGVAWTCEGLLARNLKRMSGLAMDIGDKERSAQFLEKARKYAAIAMRKAEGDDEAKAALRKELGVLMGE